MARPATGTITGTVKSGTAPLPGVSISAANTLTGKKVFTSTRPDGSFTLAVPGRGRWVVRAELPAFAAATKEIVFTPEILGTEQRADLELVLLSRKAQMDEEPQAGAARPGNALAGGGFQNLSLAANGGSGFGGEGAQGLSDAAGAMPAAAMGGEAATESVSVTGAMGRTEEFGFNQDELNQRIAEARGRGEFGGAPGGPGGFGGGPGGGFGGGGAQVFVIGGGGRGGRGGRGFDVNKVHGQIFYNLGDSVLDANPYSLGGVPQPKPQYSQSRIGFFLGGPLNIPRIYKGGSKTLFFLNYFGQVASNPFDVFGTVPTVEESAGTFSDTIFRSGPFANQHVRIFDPVTHVQFVNNTLPAINPAALGLLDFIPLPNQPAGVFPNFHRVTSTGTLANNVNFRLIHNFGSGSTPRGPGGLGRFGGNSLFFGFNYRRASSDLANLSPSIGGSTASNGLNLNAGYSRAIGRLTTRFNFNLNRSHFDTHNLYQNVLDVEQGLGINEVSNDSFDWGAPTLSFSHYNGLSDIGPSLRDTTTATVSATFGYNPGRHNLRFGGGYSRTLNDLRANSNPRGAFLFTGLATADTSGGPPAPGTGYDFADFLLGLPQQTSIQHTTNRYRFRANAFNLFVQDDWRLRGNLTLNLGLRYEYTSPFTELSGQLVNLDVAPGFTAVVPVQAGQSGPFTGAFPSSLIQPDRNNFSPRVGLAWRIRKATVVRAGYSIHYNNAQYGSMVQQLAFQPPFSFTQTNTSGTAAITLQNGFPPPTATVTNNYAVQKDYRLGYAQVWNLDIQRELPGNVMLDAGYTGTKGTRLDVLRAPNRGPSGLLLPNVQAFLLETSDANSMLHSGSIRLRKRMQHGVAVGGSYTYSKSLDDASSIGGGASVVAQDNTNIAAERGLSSFDQRHRFTADYVMELPFGTGRRWLSKQGWGERALGGWTFSGQMTVASGTPWTARVLGDFLDVARRTNGTLRADYLGLPIRLDNPTLQQWFNTAVFAAPPAGAFGDSARNIIIGPGSFDLDMSLGKTIPIKESRSFEVRVSASNVFNHPNYSVIDTVVNSPTFGQVTAVSGMRKVQFMTRFSF